MALDNPALKLAIQLKDAIEILEGVLKEKNWNDFETNDVKLVYVPYYLFNYDTIVEQDVQGQPYSQGFSGLMAMNAVTGKLEPMVSEIVEKQPVAYEKDISHGLEYELQRAAINSDEVKDTAKIKLAAQFFVKRENLAVSGVRLVYWPLWRVFVTLPKVLQKLEIDGVAGPPMNIEEVPEKEKTWIEVTHETLEKMKSPQGWTELSGSLMKTAAAGAKTAVTKEGAEESGFQKAVAWLVHSSTGRIALAAVLLLIVVWWAFFSTQPKPGP